MNKLRVLVTGSALAGALLLGSADQAAAQRYNWSGFYVGAHVGGSWGDYRVRGDDGAFDEAGPESITLDPAAFIGGFQVGYNLQTGGLVLGVEADVSFARGKDSFTVLADPDNFARATLGTHGTLTARVGLPTGQFMPYIKGGLAWSHLRANAGDIIDGTPNIDPVDETRTSKTLAGWTIGGGLEYAFSSNWSAKAEYLFMDFRSFSSTNSEGDRFEHDLEVHSVRFGLNYKFGGDRDHRPMK